MHISSIVTAYYNINVYRVYLLKDFAGLQYNKSLHIVCDSKIKLHYFHQSNNI